MWQFWGQYLRRGLYQATYQQAGKGYISFINYRTKTVGKTRYWYWSINEWCFIYFIYIYIVQPRNRSVGTELVVHLSFSSHNIYIALFLCIELCLWKSKFYTLYKYIYIYIYIYRKSAGRFSRGTVLNTLKQSRINIMRGKKDVTIFPDKPVSWIASLFRGLMKEYSCDYSLYTRKIYIIRGKFT